MMFSKRWLVIVLILAMCLSQMQVSAFAITSDGTGETSESLDQIGSLQLSASEFNFGKCCSPNLYTEHHVRFSL